MTGVMGHSWRQVGSACKRPDTSSTTFGPSPPSSCRLILAWCLGLLSATASVAPAFAQTTGAYPAQGGGNTRPYYPPEYTVPQQTTRYPQAAPSQPTQRYGQPAPNSAPVPARTAPTAQPRYPTAAQPRPYPGARPPQAYPPAQTAPGYYYPQRAAPAQPPAQAGPRTGAGVPTRPAALPWPYSGGLPPVIPYRDGQPIPPGYRLESSGGGGLIAAGLVMGGAVYGAGLIIAANAGFNNGTGWLVLPIIGPWAAIGARKIPCTSQTVNLKCIDAAGDELRAVAYLTADGLFQAIGLTLLLAGGSARQHQLVRNDIAGVRFFPHYAKNALGLDAVGTF
jgi:hypothetical protein